MTISEQGRDVMRIAIDAYGKENQKNMCIEECAELIDALSKEKRGRVKSDDVIGEIADVLIMCEQMAMFYGESEVSNRITQKLVRLKSNLCI